MDALYRRIAELEELTAQLEQACEILMADHLRLIDLLDQASELFGFTVVNFPEPESKTVN